MPILLQHSADDDFVPPTASRLLAAKRPDLVTYHEWTRARHTRLWNFDQNRFNREIAEWLALLGLTAGRQGYESENASVERVTDQRA